MSKHIPSLASRAAFAATTAAAAALVAVHPVSPLPVAGAAPAPAPVAPPVVSAPVLPVAQAVKAPAAPPAPAAAPAPAVAPAPAAVSATALRSALSKLGSPYRYGATGPSAFDCSGLVGWAYKNAGISLPRTSRAQSQVGTPVSRDALQPGDLVFFYQPVSHVGIYVGNGNVVHASTSGQPVKISPISKMPFNSARRV